MNDIKKTYNVLVSLRLCVLRCLTGVTAQRKISVNPVPFSRTFVTVLSPLGALVIFKDYANSSHFCFLFRGVFL